MPRPLTGSEFKATLTDKMHDVTQTVANVLDIWPYVESVPVADLEGHAIYEHFVEVVYRSDDGYYDHVLAMTKPLFITGNTGEFVLNSSVNKRFFSC